MPLSDYIRHFCVKCQYETDHVRLIYIDHTLLCCMACQAESVVNEAKEEEEEDTTVKKTYTIVSIDEKDRNVPIKKRMVVVELLRKLEPDKLGEKGTIIETMMVQYPAYGADHFPASVAMYPDDTTINFVEAKAVSKEIKKFIT